MTKPDHAETTADSNGLAPCADLEGRRVVDVDDADRDALDRDVVDRDAVDLVAVRFCVGTDVSGADADRLELEDFEDFEEFEEFEGPDLDPVRERVADDGKDDGDDEGEDDDRRRPDVDDAPERARDDDEVP